ncbi:MAG: hypothetical protein HYZ75_11510 [Elusimicrobia bacterium]|nr:hypothetical protein [Elusimicrobiota bacterium]
MSFLGRVPGSCPNGCEAGEYEVWSFVRGDKDDNLRLALLTGELNLVICDNCRQPFFPDSCLVYVDKRAAMTAFVFPESYRVEEAKWRSKMAEDFKAMKETLGSDMTLGAEPELYFGYEALRQALQGDDDREDEAAVGEWLLKGLKLVPFYVDPAYARSKGLPRYVPLAGPKWSAEAARAGVDALLKANDRLVSFEGWRKLIDAGEKPPARKSP